ncbi:MULTISPECIES: hypothetical protein [unclassified Streptomyces]|uniref:hypothetical protein n=1 Tax=unclassified Streptomyces TaxID=2593676 RepID=UPI0006AFA648|nr:MULTISPECIES: hypothetical protein [unclassified Streptomyces]KOU88205.1 hypothetical protein ADK93_13770 [Streptomyces sp. XY58]KOV06626.1 hypothetical protein ADK89_14120 [Streptomyces sp. XY37]KOV49281.1 hypothetical protein ADK99_13820 [Streptomyces sp. MMG1064]
MIEIARGRGRTGDVELGAVPEVAALGNTLTDLFNGLGVTQAAYAARIHVDKSAVSRHLAWQARDQLLRQIEELRSQLAEALRQRDRAEEHGRQLRARVLSLEEELAGRQGYDAPDLPALEEVQELLGELWRAGDHAGVVRELVTAAHARPLADVLALVDWLPAAAAGQLVADAARMRPVPDVLAVGAHPGVADSAKNQTALIEGLAARLSPAELARACGAWAALPEDGSRLADRALAAAVRATSSLDEARQALSPVAELYRGACTPRATGRALAVQFRKTSLLDTVLMALELPWPELITWLTEVDATPYGGRTEPRFLPGLLDLDPEVRTAVVRALAAHTSIRSSVQFAQELYGEPGDERRAEGRVLLEVFLEAGEAAREGFEGRLRSQTHSTHLRNAVARWSRTLPVDRS